MERGDIAEYSIPGQACVFEGLIAHPPVKKNLNYLKCQVYEKQGKWDDALRLWVPNELPLKSMIHHIKHLGISTTVITFLSADAVDPVYRWLLRKGVSADVLYYESASAYADDLKYDRSVRAVYVPDQNMAFDIGMRAVTVSSTATWGL